MTEPIPNGYRWAIIRNKMRNREITHCPRGHAYDEENTIIRQTGQRRCRECTRLYHARRYDKVRGKGPGQGSFNKNKTHCKQGHKLSGANVRLTKAGRRKCVACNAAWSKVRRVGLEPTTLPL